MMENKIENFRAGFVGLLGQPNAGKSSLVNQLVDEKVSIVTAKPQTTRRRVLGIRTEDQAQFVFVDSPGVVSPGKGLFGFLAIEAKDVIDSSDVVLVVLSLDEEKPENLQEILKMAEDSKKPCVFVIHKVDLAKLERRIVKIREMILAQFPGAQVFALSSQKLDLELKAELLKALAEKLPTSPKPLYEADLFTPHSTRELVAEIVREKCFETLHQEIPYSMAVHVTKYDESEVTLIRIYVDLWIARSSQKPIVIGKEGQNLKRIGTLARKEIEKMLGQKVYLALNVKVEEDWMNQPRKMKELGYVNEPK